MRLLFALLVAVALAGPAWSQSCSAADDPPFTVVWPDAPGVEPVWEMKVLPPSLSSGITGSGLEVLDVTFNGRRVMKQGHVPILNVKYEEGCDCYRDWSYQNQVFDAPGTGGSSCLGEATPGSVATMCDVAPANCTDTDGDGEPDTCADIGDFAGVAVERFADRLVLSTQYQAGWYRYTMRWTFLADGTIQPRFGFTSTGSACTQNPRRHHAYWRFDFDVEGADHDYVTESSRASIDGEITLPEIFATETRRTWGEPSDEIVWTVLDLQTQRGYTVAPSAADYLTPVDPNTGILSVDTFAREDAVIARHKNGEIDDGIAFTFRTPSCDAEFEGDGNATRTIVNGEDVYNTDVVFWYRSGVTKPDIDPGTCYVVGPNLTPVGDWRRAVVATEDGAAPSRFTLSDPYPNPFDGTTTVRFSVETAQAVTLTLYDSAGRAVRTVYTGTPVPGTEHAAVIDGSGLPSGVYTLRLRGNAMAGATRLVILH